MPEVKENMVGVIMAAIGLIGEPLRLRPLILTGMLGSMPQTELSVCHLRFICEPKVPAPLVYMFFYFQ